PKGIRVFVRIRPLLGFEDGLKNTSFEFKDGVKIVWKGGAGKDLQGNEKQGSSQTYTFDGVATQTTDQKSFFDFCGAPSIVDEVLRGYNATIFAYGQTGSGKTHTMEGFKYDPGGTADFSASTPEDAGLTPRCIAQFFQGLARLEKEEPEAEYRATCSYLQIYNERILDLLAPDSGGGGGAGAGRRGRGAGDFTGGDGLRLRWGPQRGFYAEGLRCPDVASAAAALRYFRSGVAQKVMAQHKLNAASSRSHCIFTLDVAKSRKDGEVFRSRLNLVDLAGSERASKTGATGRTLQESIGINQSLFVLRKVIQALADRGDREAAAARGPGRAGAGRGGGRAAPLVPYRDAKLTSLLKNSLGGNALTAMVACLAPADAYAEENLSTVQYAARAQAIRNAPRRNLDAKSQLIARLRAELKALRAQLRATQVALVNSQARWAQQGGDGDGAGP
ncbi:unnamed protein product, partial [Heterosigma akashiwo]